MNAIAQFSGVAPRDFLSAEHPSSVGTLIEIQPRASSVADVAESVLTGLREYHGIRAWCAWVGNDGVFRVAVRRRP